jgi:universal stress protein E
MAVFTNILAGVHLSWGRQLGLSELNPIARDVSRSATWLAQKTDARLTFLSALNLSPETLTHPSAGGGTVEEVARRVLDGVVQTAREAGVEARGLLVLGSGPAELLRQVRQDGHDLLLIGTRDLHGIRRMLFGRAAAGLIHHCPCPVWVAKPRPALDEPPWKILVASNLGAAAEHALDLVLPLAKALGARVHVLHVVDYPLDYIWVNGEPDPATAAYHRRVRAEAEEVLQEQLRQAHDRDLGVDVQLHFADMAGLPDVAILEFIQEHHIDLLALGVHVRGSLEGFLMGNPAERLLPEVPCSLLAVPRAEPPASSSPAAEHLPAE